MCLGVLFAISSRRFSFSSSLESLMSSVGSGAVPSSSPSSRWKFFLLFLESFLPFVLRRRLPNFAFLLFRPDKSCTVLFWVKELDAFSDRSVKALALPVLVSSSSNSPSGREPPRFNAPFFINPKLTTATGTYTSYASIQRLLLSRTLNNQFFASAYVATRGARSLCVCRMFHVLSQSWIPSVSVNSGLHVLSLAGGSGGINGFGDIFFSCRSGSFTQVYITNPKVRSSDAVISSDTAFSSNVLSNSGGKKSAQSDFKWNKSIYPFGLSLKGRWMGISIFRFSCRTWGISKVFVPGVSTKGSGLIMATRCCLEMESGERFISRPGFPDSGWNLFSTDASSVG